MDTSRSETVPLRLRRFDCDEYFGVPGFRDGVFLPEACLQVVYPESQVHLDEGLGFLAIGSAGADGIEFGYRAAHSGVWAFHPIESRFQHVAESLGQLVEGYRTGAIKV